MRYAAALGKTPLSLAEALRMGAHTELDRLIEKFKSDAAEARIMGSLPSEGGRLLAFPAGGREP